MKLVLSNTLTKRCEVFKPRTQGNVKLFTCGPSVYRLPHIGNFRTFLFEDVLHRYLSYLGYSVNRLINFTDLEDKAINTAEEEGKTVEQITAPVIEQFYRDAGALDLLLPHPIPRSTTSIDQAVVLIRKLIEKKHAYWHDGNVYFDPLTFPGFGEIYGLDMSNWPKKKVRFSQDTYNGNRWNRGDFILWHGYKNGHPAVWDTEIGKGRPGWNVQDPAMITKHLGYEIDIHCGGIDNIYRHHDYNRAVVSAAGGTEFCHYWLHGEHLIVNGQKMSKSKGNTLYPQDIFKKGYTGKELRFHLIYGHYKQQMNVTFERLKETKEKLRSLRDMIAFIDDGSYSSKPNGYADKMCEELLPLFETMMNGNLHVDYSFDAVYGLVEDLFRQKKKKGIAKKHAAAVLRDLKKIDSVFCVIFP